VAPSTCTAAEKSATSATALTGMTHAHTTFERIFDRGHASFRRPTGKGGEDTTGCILADW
jgi:hypothetical protein